MTPKIGFQISLFVGIVACNSGGQQQITNSDSTTKVNEVEAVRKPNPINDNDALILYKAHAIEAKANRREKHPCKEEAQKGYYLKYLRLSREHITDHIRLDTNMLPGFGQQYHGIRIYPYMPKGDSLYIVVYTKRISSSPNSRHRDDVNTFRVMKISIPDSVWCDLGHTLIKTDEKYRERMNHKLCDPDCPDTPSLPW